MVGDNQKCINLFIKFNLSISSLINVIKLNIIIIINDIYQTENVP